MTIDRASLLRAIGTRKLADWVLTERRREALAIDDAGGWRHDDTEHLRVLVRRDLPSGRGTGVIELQEQSGDAAAVIGQAVALAEAAVEPAWATPPPSAPARVELLDPLAAEAFEPAAAELRTVLQQTTARTGLSLLRWRLQVHRETVTLGSAQGFEVAWKQSMVRVDAIVERNGERARLRRQARRIVDLDLPGAATSLGGELALPAAQPSQYAPPPQPVRLELGPEAMLGHDERGVWGVFAAPASAGHAGGRGGQRDRLAQRPRGSRGTATASEREQPSLTLWSDGALPFGTRSAPVGEEGEAVRRFRLFSEGELGEPGMGPREAARRGGAPNGGVRNLVVNAGAPAASAADPARAATPLLEVRRLRWLRLDAQSGHADAELELAIDRERGTVVRGGTFSIELLGALVTGERAATLVRRGAYHGPAWIRLGPVQLR